ncbi:MAG: hypothetical protein CMO40_03740 [Verrucomicrobiaceae bacterium]|nr:hypothetical protein [Verrucomicrobiaceae bacterium]
MEASRGQMTESSRSLRHGLHPARAVAAYLRRHPLQVFGTTTAGVALITWVLRPRSESPGNKPSRSIGRRLTGLVITLLKSSLRSWIIRQTRDYLQTKP